MTTTHRPGTARSVRCRTRHIALPLLVIATAACAPGTDGATDGATDGVTAARAPATTDSVPRSCTAAQLTASRLGGDAGAGQRGVTYALRNDGRRPCLLGGVPGVVLLDSTGVPMPEPLALPSQADFGDATTAEHPVTLAPGDSAAFQITFTGISAGALTCRRATALRIVPPGAADTLVLADTISPCGPRLRVTPVLTRIPPVAAP